MTEILIKKVQTYFSHRTALTKPETRCFKKMTLGILKSKFVFVNPNRCIAQGAFKAKGCLQAPFSSAAIQFKI